jgi:hypothetical protein
MDLGGHQLPDFLKVDFLAPVECDKRVQNARVGLGRFGDGRSGQDHFTSNTGHGHSTETW